MANIDNAYKAGQNALCGDYTAYTPSGVTLFKKANRWFITPQIGDLVYFYTTSLKRVSHIGAVVKVQHVPFSNKYTITTIEGNTSSGAGFSRNGGCVAKKAYTFTTDQVGGTNRINGFGRPIFGNSTCTVNEFISVLENEVGYIEKSKQSTVGNIYALSTQTEKVADPSNANYTKYGVWHGLPNSYWCSIFQCWCMYMACKKHLTNKSTGWVQDAKGLWYYHINGVNVKNAWQEIGGFMYFFDASGIMKTGWIGSDSTGWYYLDPGKGYMKTSQWVQGKDNKWYYVASDGLMVTHAYVKHEKGYCYMDDNGIWDGKYNPTVPAGAEIAQ